MHLRGCLGRTGCPDIRVIVIEYEIQCVMEECSSMVSALYANCSSSPVVRQSWPFGSDKRFNNHLKKGCHIKMSIFEGLKIEEHDALTSGNLSHCSN